jgi:hypothetical protein
MPTGVFHSLRLINDLPNNLPILKQKHIYKCTVNRRTFGAKILFSTRRGDTLSSIHNKLQHDGNTVHAAIQARFWCATSSPCDGGSNRKDPCAWATIKLPCTWGMVLTAEWKGSCFCSPLSRFTARYSYSMPLIASAIRTLHEHELRKYEYRAISCSKETERLESVSYKH